MYPEISAMLQSREKTHGPYENTAFVANRLQRILFESCGQRDIETDHVLREAMAMICQKMARMVSGDVNSLEHWIDVAGYAVLVIQHRLKVNTVPPKPSDSAQVPTPATGKVYPDQPLVARPCGEKNRASGSL